MSSQPVYRGRYIAIGMLEAPTALYRVSSRSFPNRRIDPAGQTAQVVPTEQAEFSDNPFISYRCYAQVAPDTVVVSNGSQIDQVVSKLRRGLPMKDALILSLAVNDFEDDGHATPRIIGALQGSTGYVGSVGAKHVGVYAFDLKPGIFMEVSTNAVPSTIVDCLEVPSARKLSAEELAADLARGEHFVGDPHFVAGLAWTGGKLAIYNQVEH